MRQWPQLGILIQTVEIEIQKQGKTTGDDRSPDGEHVFAHGRADDASNSGIAGGEHRDQRLIARR